MDIIDHFGIDLTDLLRYNNLSDMMLQQGMTVQIPTEQGMKNE